ncbi:MAG: SAM-dependent methyltransferase [Flavobacteriales bacterium]|nr:SAM-dependent methyltransferase [Flavobacteriales bacterium]
MSKIIEKIEFIYQFLNKPKTVGAITPSSKHLTKKILSFVDFKKEGLVLLEYGPGTGPFTSEIIKYLKPTDQLIVIELNPKFATDLKEKFKDYKNVKIHEDCVANTQKILDKEGIKKVDYIISGIPFSSLPKDVTEDILINTKSIMSNTTIFLTFQYSKFKKESFEKYFEIIDVKFVFRNIPSAFVFCMKKLV